MEKKLTFKMIVIHMVMLLFLVTHGYAQCSELIFSDEFSDSTVDLNKWRFDIGDGCDVGLCGWGNAEEQYFRAENTTIQNGKLVITTQLENFGGKQYTSSKLTTSGKFNSKFGRYEASIKLPSAGGIWPAFWLLPENGSWPTTGEIDIMEAQHKNPASIGGTVHYNNGGHQYNGREYHAGLDLSEGFHEYAVEWEPDVIRWYVDDTLYHTVTRANTVDPWPFDQGDWYIILNVSVGGPGTPYTGNIAPSPADYPTQMEVDYVHVYSGTFNTQITGDNKVYEGESGKAYTITPIDGATYNWTVPNGASITSGQGTNSILVNWGTVSGDVKASVNVPGCGISDFKMSVSVNPIKTLEYIYEDFEGNRDLVYTSTTDGALTQSVTNPDPNSTNNSSTVGRYVRATGAQYDGLYMTTSNIGNALEYTSGEKTIWLDVYSDAPIGTEFMLQIENGSLSAGDWPSGRHSRYTAKTTSQNQWETLEFEIVDRPDPSVGAFEVNQFVLLIDPDSYTGHTVYIDNMRKMDAPDPVLLDEVIIANYDGVNNMTHFFENGEFTNVANPAPNSVNGSSNVAQYVRDSFEVYDVVSFSTDVLENTGPFVAGDNIFFMDVYTSAAVGTEIILSLENQGTSENDFPAGRNSQYSSVVKEQNAWHTVAFSYVSSPDGATSNLSVNEISLLFNSGSNTSDTYYFDNFRYGVTKLPPTYSYSEMIQDYNGANHLSLNGTTTGIYNANVGNPGANDVNNSSLAGQYVRDNTELYDVLFFNTNYINDASAYVSGEKRFAMDVYTSAPVGTVVSWQLEAGTIANTENYPSGRHSIYQAAVKEQNAWHTIEFVFTGALDLIVEDSQIDNVVLLFNPGQETGDTFYIDNLRILTKDAEQPDPPVLSSVIITPLSSSINVGETQLFSAQGYDQYGENFDASYTWSTTGGTISSTGLFSGAAEGSFTVTATNGSVSGSADITVVGISNPGISLPGIVEAEDYNEGGEGVGYHDVNSGNTGGAYRNDDVDIENTGDATGSYNVGWIEAGEWLAYNVNATATIGVYDIDFRVASPSGNGSFHLELDGTSITDIITVPTTGAWQNYETVTVDDVNIGSGNHELRVVFDSNGLNLNFVEFRESSNDTGGGNGCSGTAANGEYSYEASSDNENPTITFIPEIAGTGNGVCILYYGTSATGPYPGYGVAPNVPFQINANQGEQVYFYYTYSLLTGDENNTAGTPDSFAVGSCASASARSASLNNMKGIQELGSIKSVNSDVVVYPNPIEDRASIQLLPEHNFHSFTIVNLQGRVIVKRSINKKDINIEFSLTQQEKGLYFLKLYGDSDQQSFKLLKK